MLVLVQLLVLVHLPTCLPGCFKKKGVLALAYASACATKLVLALVLVLVYVFKSKAFSHNACACTHLRTYLPGCACNIKTLPKMANLMVPKEQQVALSSVRSICQRS